jgi:hypothetical protein
MSEWIRRHRRLATGAAVLLVALVVVDLQWESRAWQRIALAEAPLSREHRPPASYTTPVADTQVDLVEFGPNHLSYRVRTPRGQLVVLPFRWDLHDQWELEGFAAHKHRDRMAVWVPAGEHEIAMRFRPRHLGAGIALSTAALCALAASFAVPLRLRKRLLDALGGPEAFADEAGSVGRTGSG